MRPGRIFLKIHSYSGLICFWYLIILGTSSLHFNHHFPFMEGSGTPENWSRKIVLSNTFNDDLLLSETLRDSLQLIGWPLPWETWHDSTGAFHFALEHPGKRYVVDYNFLDNEARVQEIPKGAWRIFNAMHGSGAVPNSGFMHVWKWYSRATIVLVVFSIFVGVYLWWQSQRNRKTGWYVLVISTVASLGWMIQLYFWG